MNKLILYEDEECNVYVIICTDKEYYDEELANVKIIRSIDIEEDLTVWPTNRPLSADF